VWYNPSVKKEVAPKTLVVLLVSLVAGALGGGFAYSYIGLRAENAALAERGRRMDESAALASERIRSLMRDVSDLTDANTNLSQTLETEQAKNALFASQIQDITGVVGTLTKLSQTDRELLKKYSKVYFLSENYVPAKLALIPSEFLLHAERPESAYTDVLPFLTRMLGEARGNGTPLEVVSAYRSFAEQQAVKTGYKLSYGSGANRFSADQGYSEHQLGTAVDLATPTQGGLSLKLADDPAYNWLLANAHRFGFVLSYPENNSYYQFEPWHWRFVGVALATDLHTKGQYFYDFSQRDIDSYLIFLFNQ